MGFLRCFGSRADGAADKCGRRGGTSTIEAINYPGPLWSCQVQSASAGRERRREAEEEAQRRQGERGEHAWRSASGSILAAPAGLGRSAAAPGLLIRLLPDPGSRGKIRKYHHLHHRSPASPSEIRPVQEFYKRAVSCYASLEHIASRLVARLAVRMRGI